MLRVEWHDPALGHIETREFRSLEQLSDWVARWLEAETLPPPFGGGYRDAGRELACEHPTCPRRAGGHVPDPIPGSNSLP